MGTQLSKSQISLIAVGCILLFYWVGTIVYIIESKKSISPTPQPPKFTSAPTQSPEPPSFTTAPTTPTPTPVPTNSPTLTPTLSPLPHLEFDPSGMASPPNAPDNFYRLGCRAALSEGLFPFSEFKTDGTFHSGTLQDYYTYDQWGWNGNTDQYSCGWTVLGGKNTCPSDPKPNQPWTDEECGICATASKDPNCIWTRSSNSCYETVGRNPNVTFVPTYRGMDISQCFYREQGYNNDKKLCCDPSVA
jgi:hypothetical protein